MVKDPALSRRSFLKGLAANGAAMSFLPGIACGGPSSEKAGSSRPNIVFVMADDLGYGDVGCYNAESKIPTPHIDSLAAQGRRFTDAHSPSAVCTPTRYGVLTGRYCWRTWLKANVVGGYTDPLIEPARTTVASMLHKRGYRTACIGKWHLGLGWTRHNGYVGRWSENPRYFSWQDGDPEEGDNVDFSKPVQGGPADLGFDYAYYTAACSTIDGPFCFLENRRTVGLPDRQIPVDKSVGADYRPRRGLMTEGFDLTQVDTIFTNKGIEFMADCRGTTPGKPFFLYLALSSPHAPWLPPAFAKGASDEGARGDMVVWADRCVGRIVSALDRLNLAENTLLIFTSDNGPRPGQNGHRSAGELRGFKSHIWEGGHRVPFIARWPGRIEAGAVSDELICLTDLTATCAAVVGAKLSGDEGPDSFNVLPALLGRQSDKPVRPDVVLHSCFGAFAIRRGKWKLIQDTKSSGGWVPPAGRKPVPGTPGQLYDLAQDRHEEHDLWDERPQVVARLSRLLDKYRTEGRSRP